MLDELADAQDLARRAELLLHGVVGVDGRLGAVGAVQVPGVETREVLQRAEDLIAADCVDVSYLDLWEARGLALESGTGMARVEFCWRRQSAECGFLLEFFDLRRERCKSTGSHIPVVAM